VPATGDSGTAAGRAADAGVAVRKRHGGPAALPGQRVEHRAVQGGRPCLAHLSNRGPRDVHAQRGNSDVMWPLQPALPVPPDIAVGRDGAEGRQDRATLPVPAAGRHDMLTLFASESLGQALRQLGVYGRDGLPVVSPDGHQREGWVTSEGVLHALARRVAGTAAETPHAQAAADEEPDDAGHARAPARPAARLPHRRDHQHRGLTAGRPETGRRQLAAGRHPGVGAASRLRPPGEPGHHPGSRGPRQPAGPRHPGPAASGHGTARTRTRTSRQSTHGRERLAQSVSRFRSG
jgi:hypothetical protein